MFEIPNSEKYRLTKNPLKEKTDILIKGVLQKQKEILKEILFAHDLTEHDISMYGEMQTIGDTKTLFYKGKPIAVFTKEEIKTEGNVTTLSQKYGILK